MGGGEGSAVGEEAEGTLRCHLVCGLLAGTAPPGEDLALSPYTERNVVDHLAGRLLRLPEVVKEVGRALPLHLDDKGRLVVLLLTRDLIHILPRDHHLLLDKVGSRLKSLVEVERPDEGLEGIPRHITVLEVDPGGDPEDLIDPHIASQLIDLLAAAEEGADLRQPSLILIGIEAVGGGSDHRTEEAVAEVLESLILLPPVTADIRGVGECLGKGPPVGRHLSRHLVDKALHAASILLCRSDPPPPCGDLTESSDPLPKKVQEVPYVAHRHLTSTS